MKFQRVYIEITNICGLACSFCPPKPNPNKTMSLSFFETILHQLKPYTKTLAFHLFGDPFTLSNLSSYLSLAGENGFSVELTTSGFYLQHHKPQEIFASSLRQLNISLNSFNKNSSSLTFESYMKQIFSYCEAKSKRSFINLRLWNLDELSSEAEFNAKIYTHLESFFSTTIDRDAKSFRLSSKTLLVHDSYFEWPSLSSSHHSHGFCYAPSSHFGILASGKVVPCCLDGEGVIALGDLNTTPLVDILECKRASTLREGFAKGICTEELCQKCSYKDRFSYNCKCENLK
ncbi:MAG: SPASM domain-containing protein [Sulfuricurvum sp.]